MFVASKRHCAQHGHQGCANYIASLTLAGTGGWLTLALMRHMAAGLSQKSRNSISRPVR
jgi:hypothetical protein